MFKLKWLGYNQSVNMFQGEATLKLVQGKPNSIPWGKLPLHHFPNPYEKQINFFYPNPNKIPTQIPPQPKLPYIFFSFKAQPTLTTTSCYQKKKKSISHSEKNTKTYFLSSSKSWVMKIWPKKNKNQTIVNHPKILKFQIVQIATKL